MLNRADRRKLKKLKIRHGQTDRIFVPLTAAEAAISKANNSELPYAIQHSMITTLREYVDALRDGKMNRTQYIRLTIMNYAAAIAANMVGHLDETGQILSLGKKLVDVADSIYQFGKRCQESGKYIATGNELKDVIYSVDFTADIIGLVPGYVMHEACKRANEGAQRSEHRAMMGKL